MGTTVSDPDAELEAAVNAVVDATPVVATPAAIDEQPAMSPQVLWGFCNDCAQNIMPFREIATRYGFVDVPQLKEFILSQNAVRRRVKELRAIWSSDDNVEIRIRQLAQHAVLAALPGTAQIMLNPRNPDATRLDALMNHAKIAGVGHAPVARDSGAGVGRFSVNIVFPNAGRTETFTTIEHVPEAERGFGTQGET
jgi:hypothetical protein